MSVSLSKKRETMLHLLGNGCFFPALVNQRQYFQLGMRIIISTNVQEIRSNKPVSCKFKSRFAHDYVENGIKYAPGRLVSMNDSEVNAAG